jgi:hypothetical protein
MRVQGSDFDERLSQNGIRELEHPRLELSIAGRDSSVADQFYTIDPRTRAGSARPSGDFIGRTRRASLGFAKQ